MQKDRRILDLVGVVAAAAIDKLAVVDHWDADLCAIGFQVSDAPRTLIYVNCYSSPANKFDVVLEKEIAPGVQVDQPIGALDAAEVIDRLRLEIASWTAKPDA